MNIIRVKSAWWFMRVIRRYRAMSYFNTVDEISVVFWRLKKEQMAEGMWPDYTPEDA